MIKKVLLLIVLILVTLCHGVFAETKTKVAILPFKIYADTPQNQLSKNIAALIKEKISAEGAQVILSDETPDTQEWSYSDFRQFGIRMGVDYVLSGSVFKSGTGISIDTKLVNIYKSDSISVYFSDAADSEGLMGAVSNISKAFISEIFQQVVVTDIEISGNKRIESDAILRMIQTQPGDIIKPSAITSDIKKIFKMGYFDDVVVEQVNHDKGVKVIFKVIEKPTVRRVKFTGNSVYEDKEVSDFVDTRTGSILNLHKINGDLKRIRLMYTEKNYHNVKVSYKIIPLEHSQADIAFKIEEGNKLKVEKITFEGNKHFDDDDIKSVMQTSEKGFFSFFTSSGNLNESEVKNDVVRIESLYKNNGFVDTKVSDPMIDIGDAFISIHFKINEGRQYTVSDIEITGDLIVPKEEIVDLVNSKKDELYNRDNIREDILAITDLYANHGFANADIRPLIHKQEEKGTIAISYNINKKQPVYFNRINISGNYKTRDKVIRREIKIKEKGLYSKEDIQKSSKNLNRLNYFETFNVKPVKTDDENILDLDVNVVEKQTGQFSFGGGYSSEEAAFLSLSVSERNLFGKGQTGKISTKFSKDSILYDIGFFEPYILDTPVSGGVDLYKEEKEFDYYDKDAIGFTGTLGYKLYDYTFIGIRYNIEDFEISNVQSTYTYMTPGSFFLSSLKPYIKYDSRDDLFLPTEGMKHMFSIEYAGTFLGSDIDYTKYLVETSYYFPLFWKFTMGLHAEGGYLEDRSADTIDIDYVKFYLGGINSIRGFDKTDINGTRDGDSRDRGGEKYVQFNAELTFPFTKKYKVAGVLFYDRGDVYRTSEDIDLGDQFSSFGVGARWASPFGPLRLEYGWVIDGKDVKKSGDGQFEFTVGASF